MFAFFRRLAKRFRSPRSLIVGLRGALSPGLPGCWASDHREEIQHVTGWNYVAVKAKAVQAMQASVFVYRDVKTSQAKTRRTDPAGSTSRNGRAKTLYGEESNTAHELPLSHPLVKLLKRPNARQSGASFRYEQVLQLESTGICLVWNVPNKFGRIVERHVIPTAVAVPIPAAPDLPDGGWRIDMGASRFGFSRAMNCGGEPFGYFRAAGGLIPAGQVQVVRWPHPFFKDDGLSPLAALWIDAAEQIDYTRFSQMKNQANPSLIITPATDVEPNEEELDRAAKKFNDKYAGSEAAGKALFLSGASKVTPLGTAPKDMGYENGFTQFRDAVLGAHGVPPIAAGIAGGGSYAAYYAQLKQFTSLTVQPILDLLAEEDTEQLAAQFGEGISIEYKAAAVDDAELLERRLATDIAARAITKREFRALRGLPPFGDERDDQIAGESTDGQDGPSTMNLRAGRMSSPEPWRTTGRGGPPHVENGIRPAASSRFIATSRDRIVS